MFYSGNNNLKHLIKEMVLQELSYQASDVPGVFWLALSVGKHSEEKTKQIASRRLEGLKGIGGSKEVVLSWLGIGRDALLVMPGNEVIKLNKLTRVLYDKPEYLISKNFAALYRIWDKNPDKDYDRHGLMQNLVDYMIRPLKENGWKHPAGALGEDIRYGYMSASKFGYEFKDNTPNINSMKDLVLWFQKAALIIAKEEGEGFVETVNQVTFQDWKKAILAALKRVGDIYKDEGEWIVKSNEFKIPKNSRLLILKPDKISDEMIKRVKEEGSEAVLGGMKFTDPVMGHIKQAGEYFFQDLDIVFKYNLDKIYKTKFAPQKKFDERRIKLMTQKMEGKR